MEGAFKPTPDDVRPTAAARGRATQARLREEERRAALDARKCVGPACGASLAGMSPKARACSQRCLQRASRMKRMVDRRLARPRCLICNGALDPHKKGSTCSRRCAYTKWNWFRRG